jgi:hypothetical protein
VIRLRAIYSKIKRIKIKIKNRIFFLFKIEHQNDLIWKTIPGYENYEISNTGLILF